MPSPGTTPRPPDPFEGHPRCLPVIRRDPHPRHDLKEEGRQCASRPQQPAPDRPAVH